MFHLSFDVVYTKGSVVVFGSGNGLVLHMWQAVTETNNSPRHISSGSDFTNMD